MSTTYHVLQDAMETLLAIKGPEDTLPLFKLIRTCAQAYDKLQIQLRGLHSNMHDQPRTSSACVSAFNELCQTVTKEMESNSLFSHFQSLLAIEKAIKIESDVPHELNEVYDDLADEFEEFGILLEKFHKKNDVDLAVQIGHLSYQVYADCNKIDFLVSNLTVLSGHDRGGADALTLYFPEGSDASDLLTKLQAINNIYLHMCYLLDIEPVSEPLEVIKIESGSKFFKVTGNKVAICIITTMIGTFSDYSYESFTQLGRVESISKKPEVIEQAIGITKELEAAGIDTTKHKEKLKIISIKLLNDISILMSGEPEVEVNGKSHSISNKHKEIYLETTRRALIEHKIKDEAAIIEELRAEVESSLNTEQ